MWRGSYGMWKLTNADIETVNCAGAWYRQESPHPCVSVESFIHKIYLITFAYDITYSWISIFQSNILSVIILNQNNASHVAKSENGNYSEAYLCLPSTTCTVNRLSISQCCPILPRYPRTVNIPCQYLSASLYCPAIPVLSIYYVNISVMPSIAPLSPYCQYPLSISQCCPLLPRYPRTVSIPCQYLSAALYCPAIPVLSISPVNISVLSSIAPLSPYCQYRLSISQCCPLLPHYPRTVNISVLPSIAPLSPALFMYRYYARLSPSNDWNWNWCSLFVMKYGGSAHSSMHYSDIKCKFRIQLFNAKS